MKKLPVSMVTVRPHQCLMEVITGITGTDHPGMSPGIIILNTRVHITIPPRIMILLIIVSHITILLIMVRIVLFSTMATCVPDNTGCIVSGSVVNVPISNGV